MPTFDCPAGARVWYCTAAIGALITDKTQRGGSDMRTQVAEIVKFIVSGIFSLLLRTDYTPNVPN